MKSQSKLSPLSARQQHAKAVFAILKQTNPNPKTELFYLTEFQLLVAVVLSAQTTDKAVNKCMEPVFKAGFTPETVLEWGAEGLLERIRTIGLAPTKAKNVFRLSEIILRQYNGEIPRTREELEALPGVGRKTANVVLAEIFKEPTLAVDTHVFRVTARLGWHKESTPEKAEAELMKVVARDDLPAAHHWLILHGRYICKAIKPACSACPLEDICPKLGVNESPGTAGIKKKIKAKAAKGIKKRLKR